MRPLFSVIVPTRNRPQQLANTLVPLSRQTLTDFEIILSDNSDSKHTQATKEIVEAISKKHNLQIRIIRPPTALNMTNHWNFAINKANGQYLGVVTDRMTLLPTTLENVLTVLQKGHCCVSYSSATLKTQDNKYYLTNPLSAPTLEEVACADVIKQFSLGNSSATCPRLLNSFVDVSTLNRMKLYTGGPLLGISPDYSFLFNYLGMLESYIHIHASLLVDHSPDVSNGLAITRNLPNKASDDFNKIMHKEQLDLINMRLMPDDNFFFLNIISGEYKLAAQNIPNSTLLPFNHERIYEACLIQAAKYLTTDETSRLSFQALEKYRSKHNVPKFSVFSQLHMQYRKIRNTYKRIHKDAVINSSRDMFTLTQLIEKAEIIANFLELEGKKTSKLKTFEC